jgi:hypothetical protein
MLPFLPRSVMRTGLDCNRVPNPTEEETTISRGIDDVLGEIRSHLTKEELLCVSLFKNSKRQSNNIHRIFLKKYHGKMLGTSAITMRKLRMLHVLSHVGALLEYKRTHEIDQHLQEILTTRQFQILDLYEKRITRKKVREMLNIKERAIEKCYKRALKRLEEAQNSTVQRYVELLRNVLKFSRKSRHSDDKRSINKESIFC